MGGQTASLDVGQMITEYADKNKTDGYISVDNDCGCTPPQKHTNPDMSYGCGGGPVGKCTVGVMVDCDDDCNHDWRTSDDMEDNQHIEQGSPLTIKEIVYAWLKGSQFTGLRFGVRCQCNMSALSPKNCMTVDCDTT